MRKTDTPLSYRDAGVDIQAGDTLVEAIKPIARSTIRDGCLGNIGGFGALFEVPARYRSPVLVSGTDGVGTKLKLAFQLDRHDSIGIDLVAMCVNDVLVQGAEPLFFLDYFATGKLTPATATAVIGGIGEGCRRAGAALIGGETAEMPGMYAPGEYDLAGFCVGVVEKDRIIDGRAVCGGDAVIGLASSGPHSNGYSLIRKVLTASETALDFQLAGRPLADHLMAPTRIYVRSVLSLLEQYEVRAIAHITGGGLPGNLVRVVPPGHRAVIDGKSWAWPPVFTWLQDAGGIATDEMYRTFNCGIGLVLVVAAAQVGELMSALGTSGEDARLIGSIEAHGDEPEVLIHG